MAQTINLGLTTYVDDFQNNNTAYGRVAPYTQYSVDLDTNFRTLRATLNTVIAELNAVQAPNAGLGTDILGFDDPARVGGITQTGRVGLDSFRVAIGSPTSQLTVTKGVVLLSGVALRNALGATLVGSGGAGTRYISVDSQGAIFQSSTINANSLDLAEATWNGSAFTAVTNYDNGTARVVQVFFDGDEYEKQLIRAVLSPTWTAKTYRVHSLRFRALERLLAGLTTDDDGAAIGPHVHPDGTASAPGLTFVTQQNLGVYRAGTDILGLATNAAIRCRVVNAGFQLDLDGTAAAPVISWSADTNMGLRREAADTLTFVTAGVDVGRFDPQGNLDLPTNGRVKGSRTATQSIATATATFIDFNAADEFDIGTWHDHASGTLGTRESFTVPTGYAGTYLVIAHVNWAAPAAAMPTLLEITLNGTAIAETFQKDVANAENAAFSLAAVLVLADADVLKVRVTQASGANVNVDAARFTIVKAA